MPRNTDSVKREIRDGIVSLGPYIGQNIADEIARNPAIIQDIFNGINLNSEWGNDNLIRDRILDEVNIALGGGQQEQLDVPFDFADFENDAGTILIGAKYKGFQSIKEREDENIFCPTSGYCLLKCYEKYFNLIGYKINGNPVSFDTTGMNPHRNTKASCVNVICNTLFPKLEGESAKDCLTRQRKEFYKLPSIFKVKFTNTSKSMKGKEPIKLMKMTNTDNNHLVKNNPNYRIALINVDTNTFHAILLKKPAKFITREMIRLEFTRDLSLHNEWTKLKQYKIKPYIDINVMYDIETSVSKQTKIIGKRKIETEILVPEALSYRFISAQRKAPISDNMQIFNSYLMEPVTSENINESDIYDQFFNDMALYIDQYIEKPKDNSNIEIQVWAHNGGKFDNIFLKQCKSVTFIDEIKSGSHIKSIRCTHNSMKGVIFNFKDTLPFCLDSLAKVSKTLKTTQKLSFDIAGWTREDYKNNMVFNSDRVYDSIPPSKDWVKYMIQDVDTLSEVFIKLEEIYNKLGTSLTVNVGLASAAYSIMLKTCLSLQRNTFCPKSESMIELIKNSMMGGRVCAYKRYFNKEMYNDLLICLDANSLYPSAMAAGSYPVGKPYILINSSDTPAKNWKDSEITCEEMKNSLHRDKVDQKTYKSTLAHHYILTIKYRVPNIKVSIIPHKTDDGRLIYPTNGEYIGSYNDVDIREMLIEEYEILEVYNGIYWEGTERIFTNLIQYLYDTRNKLKAEGDSMEYVYKILCNSMYGKFCESITDKSYFSDKSDESVAGRLNKGPNSTTLMNGQIENTTKFLNPMITKPTHIASYITAYSRAIMNEYIRKIGIDNIFYTDTDSIYCLKSAFEKSGIKTNSLLGGVKNDYGENVYIEEAFFLDQKRYFLQKVDLSSKVHPDEYNELVCKIHEITDQQERKVSISKLPKDPRPISSKYLGLSFRDYVENYYSNDAGSPILTNDQKNNIKSIYTEILSNYNEYIFDSRDPLEKRIKTVILLLNKWKRSGCSISIDKMEIKFAINPEKKGLYLPDPKCSYQYHSLGFDINKPVYNKVKNYKPLGVIEVNLPVPLKTHECYCKDDSIRLYTALPLTTDKTNNLLFNKALTNKIATDKNIIFDYYLLSEANGNNRIIYRSEQDARINNEEERNNIIKSIENGEFTNTLSLNGTNIYSDPISNRKFKVNTIGSTGVNRISEIIVKYYRTCQLGPTVEIEISDEQLEKKMFPLIAISNKLGFLENAVKDKFLGEFMTKLRNVK